MTASAVDHNIDIICVQEHYYLYNKDIKYHDTCNGSMFISATAEENTINAAIVGVGMFIWPRALKSLNSI